MVAVCPILFLVWKLIHKTKRHKPHEVDLQKDLAEILEYHKNFVATPPKNAVDKWFNKIFS
jgi:amino acid transporter